MRYIIVKIYRKDEETPHMIDQGSFFCSKPLFEQRVLHYLRPLVDG